MSIVSAEADGKNIGGVTDKSASGCPGVKVPQAECVVPRRRKGELSVGRDYDVRDKVVMAMEDSFWVSVRVLIASQCPDNNGFIYSRRD